MKYKVQIGSYWCFGLAIARDKSGDIEIVIGCFIITFKKQKP